MKKFLAIHAIFLAAIGAAARADTLASSNFATDPTNGDPRFTYSATDQSLTAHYDTALPTDKLLFPLAHSLTAEDSFTLSAALTIHSANFFADPNGFAQISFGLVNSSTTGNDRSGGVPDGTTFGSDGNAYDSVTVDYFPNISPFFDSPTLSPTVITSQTGTETEGAFSDLNSVFGAESELDGPGESPLPLDTPLTATLTYDASSRLFTLQLASASGPLLIDAGGDEDGDSSTIQMTLPAGVDFNVDSFAIPLWTDSYAFDGPSVVADVTYSSFSVTTAAPEPASLGFVSLAGMLLLQRRR